MLHGVFVLLKVNKNYGPVHCDSGLMKTSIHYIRIIEPLTSRCSKFRFKPLPESILMHHLSDISKREKLDYDDEVK